MNHRTHSTRAKSCGAALAVVALAALSAQAQGTSTSSSTATGSNLTGPDSTFVVQAARMNTFEIQSANFAQGSASSQQDKSFAQQMITDHTKAARQLQSAVTQTGSTMTLPTDLDAAGQARLDSLRNSGRNFDALYKTQMVAGHQEMYSLMQNYSSKSDANAAIKSTVTALMPVVQQHLNSAKQLPGSGTSTSSSQ